MARDKAKDDNLFHCSQAHEHVLVANHYEEKQKVLDFLKEKCDDNTIYHSTHKFVYELIEKELGYPVPV